MCGGSTLRNFHTENFVLIWLIYGTSARSAVVRDRPCFTYSHRNGAYYLILFTKVLNPFSVV